MARKKKHEEHENHERWLVSYADFITLLFAFFVVMYSVSAVNEGKYRVLSESLQAAFRAPARSITPIQVGEISKTAYGPQVIQKQLPIMMEMPGLPQPRITVQEQPKQKEARGKAAGKALEKVSEQIMHALSSLIDQGLIKVKGNELQVEVEINTEILFESGSATLARTAIPMLETLAAVLVPFANDVLVEGYTDNIPIKSGKFPSNWELSASRAASVVHLFSASGIDPGRMAAIGYGEHRPVASNETAEGRAMNRRVVLVIPAVKPGSETHKTLVEQGLKHEGRFSETKGWTPLQDVTPGRDISLSEFEARPQEEGGFGRDSGLLADIEIELGAPTGMRAPGTINDGLLSTPIPSARPGKVPLILPPVQLFEIPGVRIEPIPGGATGRENIAVPGVIGLPIKSPIDMGLPLRKKTAGQTGAQDPVATPPTETEPSRGQRHFRLPEPEPAADMTLHRDLSLTPLPPRPQAAESTQDQQPAPAASTNKKPAPARKGGMPAFTVIPPPISLPQAAPERTEGGQ